MRKKITAAVVIGILLLSIYFIAFKLLFVCFSVKGNMERKYQGFEYGTSVLLEGVFRPALYDSNESEGAETDYILMFRWKYKELLNRMKETLQSDINNLICQNMISEYYIDEQAMTVKLTVKGCIDETEIDRFYNVNEEINDICSLCYIFTYKELPEEAQVGVTLYDVDGNQTQDIPVLMSEEAEKAETRSEEDNKKSAYNEKEINCLEKILSRSKNKKVFDYNDDWKIRGYEDGGNIWYLDLSDYSDITGSLDLSDFTELKYVELKGMKIDTVILPDSLKSIKQNTFNNCKNLTEITIPKSVTSFSNPVFSGCKSLKEIVFEENAPKIFRDNEDIFGKGPEDLIIYRKKSAKGWQEICWDKYDVRIIDE